MAIRPWGNWRAGTGSPHLADAIKEPHCGVFNFKPTPKTDVGGSVQAGKSRGLLRSGALAAALMAAGASTAAAGELVHELKLGVLANDVDFDDLWRSFDRDERKGFGLNFELSLSPSMPVLWGVLRPAIGGTLNTHGHANHAYFDVRWEVETPSRVFFALGLGVAVHDGPLKPESIEGPGLGSRVLFHIPVEIGYRFDQRNSLSLFYEHMSNAGLASPNDGIDYIGLRYSYRF